MSRPQLLINHLFYSIPDTHVNFSDLMLCFQQQTYGIVGDNGVGKTTLLKLLVGQLQPDFGAIHSQAKVIYCPQYLSIEADDSVSSLLGIEPQLLAIKRIHRGLGDESDYDLVADSWDLHVRVEETLKRLDLSDLDLNRNIKSLSGGQKTKCLLARAMIAKADFLLLDEPTNNLDLATREVLYEWISSLNCGLLVVSHDRQLLDLMTTTIELTTKGVNVFGGNYSFYQQQKALHQEAMEHQLAEAERQIKLVSRSIQVTREKHARRAKKGKALRKEGKIDKLTANSMRGRAEKTQSRNTLQADKMLQEAQEIVTQARERIENKETINVCLEATRVPQGKIVIEIKNLCFSYENQEPLFNNFNFMLMGSERVALEGSNGSGKTTLLKLLQGKLEPLSGKLYLGVQGYCYLDQEVDFLVPELNLIMNYQRLNPEASTNDTYAGLAKFNFRNKEAEKRVGDLSGGERIRAGLAIALLAKTAPQLIIVDEPTNHLDLRSIAAIEDTLCAYQGAMIVVSHDQQFLKNINISRRVSLK